MTTVAETVERELAESVLSGTVLILNASYEPLHSVSVKHAIKMLVREVAVVEEAHEFDGAEVMIGSFKVPRVLRLVRYVVAAWKHRTPGCTKNGIKARDGKCAYCNGPAETVDHIVPRSRGGKVTWMNAVAACLRCNHRKADRTPAEAGMVLLLTPHVPKR